MILEPAAPCIHTAFEEQARSDPTRALLVDSHGYMTQRELLDSIDRLARRLLARCGGPDRVVAVRLEPSIESVVSYFACLAAGLRYLPVPVEPAPLVQRLLQSLPPQLLLTRSALGSVPGVELDTLFVDAAVSSGDGPSAGGSRLPAPDPRRIAHLLPTSGSETGRPKIVFTDHVGSLLSYDWRSRLWPYDPRRDVVGCNIFGIWDVVPALCHGVPVVMIDDAAMRDPCALAATVIRYGITRLMLTPTLLDACLACDDGVDALHRLHRIVLCGEAVTAALMERAWAALPRVRFGNLYSLSECHDVAGGELRPGRAASCGRVADFADVYITDPDDRSRLMPSGQAGRVLIGGAALATAYLDPVLTAERFFEVSFGTGQPPRRVYDSGDLGILHDSGTLEIVGRVDEATKIRGAWAEPDSIAKLLREHPDVAQAWVTTGTDGRARAELRAFVVPRRPGIRELGSKLRAWLGERVAAPSVPARIGVVDTLPLLPSGKADLRRLCELEWGAAETPPPGPGQGLDAVVLATFRGVLERPDASPDADFESLGGDSLNAIVLCGELQRQTGRRVTVGDLHLHPTAAALSRQLERRARGVPRREWQLAVDLDFEIRQPPPRMGRAERVFVTGATGALGRAFVRRLLRETDIEIVALMRGTGVEQASERLLESVGPTIDQARLTPVIGDLSLPRLGLDDAAFERLAMQTDAIVHVGADLDMFAEYQALAPVNVGGTREVLRLAAAGGARLHHLSSSAVLPLDQDRSWNEDSYGFDFTRSLAPEHTDTDGYSRSKLAAESLVWLAVERGLDVTVTRIPHLVGEGGRTRLSDTLRALLTIGVLPEGKWGWQLAPVGAVCRHLLTLLDAEAPPSRLMHLTTRPLRRADIEMLLTTNGIDVRSLSLPAVVVALAEAAPVNPGNRRILAGLNQLVREHGPRAALSLADARLGSRHVLDDDPKILIDELILDYALKTVR